MRITKLASVAMTACLLLQLSLPATTLAETIGGMPDDLTGQTSYLTIHGTDGAYADSGGPSSLTVTTPEGAEILPVDDVYSAVPAGATLDLTYVFSLADGDGSSIYTYSDASHFTITLPEGITFASSSGGSNDIYATDSATGASWLLGTWSLADSHTIQVQLSPDAANHTGIWGSISITGSFDAVGSGGGTDTSMTLGSQTVTFTRPSAPTPQIELAKQGVYDASTNEITWTVTATPPDGVSLDGYTLVDTYSANQTYVSGSFGGGSIPDTALALGANQISYTFPSGTSGEQTVTYKTTPSTFSAETGTGDGESSTFTNTAVITSNGTNIVDPVQAHVTVDWLSKTGTLVATSDGSTVIRWDVTVTVPEGGTINGAQITDTLPAGLQLIEGDSTYPVTASFGTSAAQTVAAGSDAGTYAYASDSTHSTLTYRLPAVDAVDGQLTGTAKLTYYTRVSDRDQYLDSNSSVSFSNEASLTWDGMPDSQDPPSDTSSVTAVGSGGLLSKSAGSTQDYSYSSNTIHWTTTVNRNAVPMAGVTVTDSVDQGQRMLIDSAHPFTVRQGDTVIFTTTSAVAAGGFISSDGFVNDFSYTFGDITSAYTIDYYSEIVDVDQGSNADSSGLDTLYANGTIGFKNNVTLTRSDGGTVTTTGTKNYQSQMLAKAVATGYDYANHTVQWQIVVNRNGLPLTNAVLSDAVPTGMELLVDAQHPFTVTQGGVSVFDEGSLTGGSGSTSFVYSLGDTSDTYTVTYYTSMSDETLQTQWDGLKDFTNQATLTADQIVNSVTASATVKVSNPIVGKSFTYATGSDHVDWSVTINQGNVRLTDASVTDVLSTGLSLDQGSVKLYEVSVASDGTVQSAAGGTLVDPGTYTVTMPTTANDNTLTVGLPDGSDATYRLEFTTYILTDDLDFTNSVSLTGAVGSPSGGATSDPVVIEDLWSNGGSGTQTLTVHKEDGSGNAVAGATYELLNFAGEPLLRGGEPITAVTDATGDAVFTNLPSWVIYAVEVSSPDGFLTNPTVFGGSRLGGGEPVVYQTTDAAAVGDVSFTKTAPDGSSLNGGEFVLTGTDYAGAAVSRTATSVDGVVTFGSVPVGEYTITEASAPTGYARTDTHITATVSYNDGRTGVVVALSASSLQNSPLPGTITLEKTDQSGNPLAGAAFGLYDQSGTLIQTATSDQNGVVTFAGVAFGTYTIRETQAPEGYELSDTVCTATVSADSVTVSANPYTVTNSKIASTADLPKTGDSMGLAPWALLGICALGIVLIVMALRHTGTLRRKGHDKR